MLLAKLILAINNVNFNDVIDGSSFGRKFDFYNRLWNVPHTSAVQASTDFLEYITNEPLKVTNIVFDV